MKHFSPVHRKISAGLIGTILTILLLNLIFQWFRLPFVSIDPIEAIPQQTAIIYESDHFNEMLLKGESTGIHSLLNIGIKKAQSDLLDKLPMLQLNEKGVEASIGLAKVGVGKIGALFSIDLNSLEDSTKTSLSKLGRKATRTYNFNGTKYHLLQLEDSTEIAFYTYRNLLLVSAYPLLIESALRQLNNYQSNLRHNQAFRVVETKKTSSDNRLYINFKSLPKFFRAFFDNDQQDVLRAIGNMAEWMRVDLSREAGAGIKGCYAPLIKVRRPANTKPHSVVDTWGAVLPDNVGLLSIQQGSNFIHKKDSVFQEYIMPWYVEEWGLAITNPRTTANRILVLRTRSAEWMDHYLMKYGERNGLLEEKEYQTYSIRRLLDADLLSPFNRQLALGLAQPYYTIIDDFVLFGRSRLALESMIDKHLVGQTLQNKPSFQQFVNEAKFSDVTLLYTDANSAYHLLMQSLNDEADAYFKHCWGTIQKEWTGGLYAKTDGQKISFQFAMNQHTKQEDQGPQLAWRVALQNKIVGAPRTFWNPNKKTYEILVQDDAHRLYFLSESGELLWKKSLDGPILSEIYQVDYQEDGQLKYFFNTPGKIYLLDSDGQTAGNYPLSLQSEATNGLCLTRIKHSYAYQYFLACTNGHAYGFTKDGNPIPGWNPKYNVGQIEQSFQYFQRRSKDHLIMLNKAGVLTAYDSEGRRLFKKRNPKSQPWEKLEILQSDRQNQIALSDRAGNITLVNHRGQENKLSFADQRPENAYSVSFVSQPKRFQNVIALGKDQLSYYAFENRRLVKQFALSLGKQPDDVFRVRDRKGGFAYFGTLDSAEKKINLYSPQTGHCTGFPLPGDTRFDLYNLKSLQQTVLVTGLRNEVYAYRIDLP